LRRALAVAAVAAVGAAVYLLWPAERRTPEDEVRLLVARTIAAAEARDVGAVTRAVAEDFRGPSGLSKQELKQLVLSLFLRIRAGVAVVNPSLDVSVTGPGAATFTGTFVFAGDGASRYEISGTLRRRGADWEVTQASWHPR
jgi:hypothetical protein